MEKHNNEWLYSELLDLLKQKEQEKEDSFYRPIELELPLIQPPPVEINEPSKNEEKVERGVIIIDL